MSPEKCREVLRLGSRRCQLSVIEGQGIGSCGVQRSALWESGFGLGHLAESLDLPVIAIVPCRGWDDLHLVELPEHCDAILLDGLEFASEFLAIQRAYRVITKKPVIGAIEALPMIRAGLRHLAEDEPVPPKWVEALGSSFLRFADLGTLRRLAESRSLEVASDKDTSPQFTRRMRIAYADDDAFGLYFPDTLETLEAFGAELVECSPLRHADLPPGTDFVLLGCGRPEFFMAELSANMSFTSALQEHVYQGGRIFAEGGGAAYLARTVWVDGHPFRGAGILPFSAMLQSTQRSSQPTRLRLEHSSWLGLAGDEVCGYPSGRWKFFNEADEPANSGRLTAGGDLVYHRHAIGSMIHLHPAALPDLVGSIARSHEYALS